MNLDKVYNRKILSYLSFLNKVRYTNDLPLGQISLTDRYNGDKIKVFVGKGNNKYLIMALLRRRFWL